MLVKVMCLTSYATIVRRKDTRESFVLIDRRRLTTLIGHLDLVDCLDLTTKKKGKS